MSNFTSFFELVFNNINLSSDETEAPNSITLPGTITKILILSGIFLLIYNAFLGRNREENNQIPETQPGHEDAHTVTVSAYLNALILEMQRRDSPKETKLKTLANKPGLELPSWAYDDISFEPMIRPHLTITSTYDSNSSQTFDLSSVISSNGRCPNTRLAILASIPNTPLAMAIHHWIKNNHMPSKSTPSPLKFFQNTPSWALSDWNKSLLTTPCLTLREGKWYSVNREEAEARACPYFLNRRLGDAIKAYQECQKPYQECQKPKNPRSRAIPTAHSDAVGMSSDISDEDMEKFMRRR
jgi:hypothetical protein